MIKFPSFFVRKPFLDSIVAAFYDLDATVRLGGVSVCIRVMNEVQEVLHVSPSTQNELHQVQQGILSLLSPT